MITSRLAGALSVAALVAGAMAACGDEAQTTQPTTSAGPASSGAGAAGPGGDGGGVSSSVASSVASGAAGAGASGGSGGSGGSSGVAGSGGGSCLQLAQPCAACAFDNCPAEYCECFANSECVGLAFCAQGCSGPSGADCLGACFQNSPSAPSEFLLVMDCAAGSCAVECAPATTLTPCEKCAAQKCEVDFDKCLSNPECWKIVQCVRNCTTASCKMACPSQFPAGEADSATLYACTAAQCAVECQ